MNIPKTTRTADIKIVIVDDAEVNLKLLSNILIPEGYKVITANDGELALKIIAEKQPSLVLLDVMMPEMDGFEVCRRLKADPFTCGIPVIFISALQDKSSIVKGIGLGGVDFISKPIHKEEVLARVKIHISLFLLQEDLKSKNENLETEIIKRQQAELAMEQKLVALTRPIENSKALDLGEFFNISELQKLQDQFAKAFGLASLIIQPDGTPITKPSNFSHLCQNIIRCTKQGLMNCMKSDALIGRHNPDGPIVQTCMSGGLLDAGASITLGGHHVASWLVGQVRNEEQDEIKLEEYAHEIGADVAEFKKAYNDIPSMSLKQFQNISQVLFTMAGQLSDMAYQNAQQARFIFERKQAEDALQLSEEGFRTTLFSIGDGVITTDSEGKVRLMNPVAEQLTGWTMAEASGKALEEVFSIIQEDTRIQVESPVEKVLREGVNVDFANHSVLIARNGHERPIADSGAPIKNGQGEIIGVVLVFRDQTEQRKTEKALRESEFFFRESQRSAEIGSYKYDLVTGFWDSSEVLDQIFGIDKEYVRSVGGWKDLIYSEDLEMMDLHLAIEVIGQKKPFNKEYRIVRKSDGKIRWVNGLGQLNLDGQGNILSLIGTIQDITARKQTDEILKESEAKFRNLFENATVGISITKMDGTMQINTVFHEMLGYSESEFRNKKWQEITHPDDIQVSMETANSLLAGQKHHIRIEKRYIHKNGNIVWTDLSTTLHRDSHHNPLYYITSIQDITQRKKIEEELQISEERFRKAVFEAPFPIMLHAEDGEVLALSRAWVELSGYSLFDIPTVQEWVKLAYGREQATLKNYIDQLYGINHWVDEGEFIIQTKSRDQRIWDFGSSPLGRLSDGRRNIITMAKDVTDRRKIEDNLVEAQKMMDVFFEQSLDGFFFMMLDQPIEWNDQSDKEKLIKENLLHLRFTRINDAMLAQYGAGMNELLGKNFRDFFNHDIKQGINVLQKIFNNGKIQIETEEQKLNGKIMYIEGDYTCLYNLEGKITGFFGIRREITENKKNIENLQKERTLLRTLIDNLPVTIYVKDREGRKIVANKSDLEIIGKASEAEVLGKTDLDIFSKEIGQRGYEDDIKIIDTGEQVINREEIFIDKNGIQRWLLTSKVPLFDPLGNTTGLVGIGRDITDQKKSNETIQKLSMVIEQNPSSIVITDLRGNIEYVNPKFTQITGYTFDEVKGENPRILKSDEMTPEDYKKLWNTISSGEIWRGEFHNRRKNGELYWEWATITSIKNEQGVISNYIAIKEDINLRKQMEKDLIIAKEKAEENDRLKSAFLANMSHEIRTPLNSIIGFAELLSDPDFETDERYEFANHISSSGNNLLAILTDIMDISKIEAGQVTINKTHFSAWDLIQEVQSEFKLKAHQKGISIDTYITHNISECYIFSDQFKLKQVLTNFVGNALKFTEKGSIEIGLKITTNMVHFFVRDTGIGIPEEFHKRIFERFRQVEDSSTRKYGGNGLGLAISKSLIEMLDGTIGMESQPGKGSTFYFTIPK